MQVQRLHLSSYYSEDFIDKEQKLVQSLGHQYLFNQKLDSATEIVLATSQVEWNKFSSEQLSNIKLIVHPNSGYDNYHFEQFHDFKAPVILGNSIRCHGVAEYSLSCLYQHFCSIPWSRQWDDSRSFPKRKLLNELNVLLFGLGHVGKIIHEALSAHRCTIKTYDPYVFKDQKSKVESLKSDSHQYDAIIMACSLNDVNQGVVDSQLLQTLKKDGCLINAARGKLVKQNDLLSFLAKNPTNFAYLDVTEKEPFNRADFEKTPNIKLTSHISGVSDSLDNKVLDFEEVSLREFTNLPYSDFLASYKSSLLQERTQKNYFI
jgi:phosphoglycerate dehydrogenase-like enzyme